MSETPLLSGTRWPIRVRSYGPGAAYAPFQLLPPSFDMVASFFNRQFVAWPVDICEILQCDDEISWTLQAGCTNDDACDAYPRLFQPCDVAPRQIWCLVVFVGLVKTSRELFDVFEHMHQLVHLDH